MDLKKLRVNGKRLQSILEQMSKIGGTGGRVQRLTLTDEDKQARDLFVTWLKEIDCEVPSMRWATSSDAGGQEQRPAAGDERLAHRLPTQGGTL